MLLFVVAGSTARSCALGVRSLLGGVNGDPSLCRTCATVRTCMVCSYLLMMGMIRSCLDSDILGVLCQISSLFNGHEACILSSRLCELLYRIWLHQVRMFGAVGSSLVMFHFLARVIS